MAAEPNQSPSGVWARLRALPRQVLTALPRNSIRGRFARGAFWSLAGSVASQALNFSASVATARLLGKVFFGELGMVRATVAMLGVFAGIGLGMTAGKHVAEFRTKDPTRAGRMIGLAASMTWITSSLMALLVLLMAPMMAGWVMNAPTLVVELRWACLLLLFSAVNGAQIGALSGLEDFRTISIVNVVQGLANLVLTVAGVLLMGLKGAVIGLGAAMAVTCLVTNLFLRRRCKAQGIHISLLGLRTEFTTLWKFSIPVFLSGIWILPVEWAMAALIVRQVGGFAEFGLFNGAKQYYAIILYLPSIISNTTMPILANLWGEGRYAQYRRFLLSNCLLMTVLQLVVCVPLMVGSPWAMGVYGPAFVAGWPVLVLFGFRGLMSGIFVIVGQSIWTTGDSFWGMALAFIRAVLQFVLFLPLRTYGAMGLTGALLASDILFLTALGIYLHYKLRHIRMLTQAQAAIPLTPSPTQTFFPLSGADGSGTQGTGL